MQLTLYRMRLNQKSLMELLQLNQISHYHHFSLSDSLQTGFLQRENDSSDRSSLVDRQRRTSGLLRQRHIQGKFSRSTPWLRSFWPSLPLINESLISDDREIETFRVSDEGTPF